MLKNKIFCFIYDMACIPLSWFFAYWIRFNLSHIPSNEFKQALLFLPLLIILQVILYWLFNLNRSIWRFASLLDSVRIIKSVFLATGFFMITAFFYNRLNGIPRSVPIIYSLLLITLLGSGRFFVRYLKQKKSNNNKKTRVLIIGAGHAGEGLIRDLLRANTHSYQPIGFVDDDKYKLGKEIHGIRVMGRCSDIVRIALDYSIDLIFIALPSVGSAEIRFIIEECKKTVLPIKILPGLNDLGLNGLTGEPLSIRSLREVKLEDLLGRDPVKLNWQEIEVCVRDKKILVSGGGGSIGSELCRQIAKLNPKELIIIEHNEFNLYSLQMELNAHFPIIFLQCYLVDITDKIAVNTIMQTHRPDIVFHAAAYKHVPILENQIRSALRNNVLGTQIMAEISLLAGVQTFVLISSDKAVNPSNIMGASKRAAEIICQNFSKKASSATRFVTVRFGNVLGSKGSVVPLFQKQIAEGGPVTVTHPDITRFFMSISEACQLILQACAMGEGDEIFVLDMGKPIKIQDLAQQMINLAGKKDSENIKISYTSLRPGEKMHEELFYKNESLLKTRHKKILRANSIDFDPVILRDILLVLQQACENFDNNLLRSSLLCLVPEFKEEIEKIKEEVMV